MLGLPVEARPKARDGDRRAPIGGRRTWEKLLCQIAATAARRARFRTLVLAQTASRKGGALAEGEMTRDRTCRPWDALLTVRMVRTQGDCVRCVRECMRMRVWCVVCGSWESPSEGASAGLDGCVFQLPPAPPFPLLSSWICACRAFFFLGGLPFSTMSSYVISKVSPIPIQSRQPTHARI